MPLNEGATNQILQFGLEGNVSGNVHDDLLALEVYAASLERKRGNQPGIAKRGLVNRALRQALHVSAGVAQFIANRYAPGVVDDGDLDKIEDGLLQAIRRIVTIADTGGIKPWDETTTYSPLPHIVWGSDNMIYIADQPSGPGVAGVGAKDPTTTTGYWKTLAQFISGGGGGGGGNSSDIDDGRDNYPRRFKTFETSASRPYWRYANGQKVTSVLIVAPELCRRFNNLTPQEAAELLLTEEEWQAKSAAFGGIGGVPQFVYNKAEDWIRLPDMRGTYDEPAGFNGRKVGESHRDAQQNITGSTSNGVGNYMNAEFAFCGPAGNGAFYRRDFGSGRAADLDSGGRNQASIEFDASRVARTGPVTEPRARVSYGCVYIGMPAS